VLACLCVVALSCRRSERVPAENDPAAPREFILPIPNSELAPIFPPVWRRGDHWRVAMTSENQMSRTINGDRLYSEIVFEMRVAEIPRNELGLFRLDVTSETPEHVVRYHAYYRAHPFSFARLVPLDDDGKPTSPVREQSSEDAPYPESEGSYPGRFLGDFPTMPRPARLGESTYLVRGWPARVQKVERTGDVLRFTIYRTEFQVVTMEWKRGAPWWSSLQRTRSPYYNHPESAFDGSGKLLESASQ
jgi:hypothetical protein